MNTFPIEVIQAIVSDLCLQLPDLFNCSLVCRTLGEAATEVLYRHVNLNIDEYYYEEEHEEFRERQCRLLCTISEKPKLASFVKVFKNHHDSSGQFEDATTVDTELSTLTKAAKNMKRLCEASLTANVLAAHIIENLPSYAELISLEVYGLEPRDHIWNRAPTNLTSLDWKVVPRDNNENPWDAVQFLLNAVEMTCPALESLNVSIFGRNYVRWLPPDIPTAPRENIQHYDEQQASTTVTLARLHHFGLQSRYNRNEVDNGILDFVRKHQLSLKSLSIPACARFWRRGDLEYILKVCNLLSELKHSKLGEIGATRSGQVMTISDFLSALVMNLASPKHSVESLSFTDIQCHLSSTIGPLFDPFKNLKFLRLGDRWHKDESFEEDGRFDFVRYSTVGLAFIKNLPPSLEELYLEINGEGLCVDEDEDFDPMCELGHQIFTTLRHLHTCDIHAWISNCDGGLGELPEKCAFYRRLPYQSLKKFKSPSKIPENKIKALWTSRMDSIYQENDVAVSVEFEVLELEGGHGQFEGKDATQVWCDGIESDYSEPSDNTHPVVQPGSSRLFGANKVAEYPMFRKRIY